MKLLPLFLITTALAIPSPHEEHHPPLPLQTLPATYTITVYAPHNRQLNGLKVESIPDGLAIYENSTVPYCPTGLESLCPNGTELAFTNASVLLPDSIVPGGQNLYVNTSGALQITVQHEHVIPPGAYWAYGGGWNWTGLPVLESCPEGGEWQWAHEDWGWARRFGCPTGNVDYDCTYPSGYWTWMAPGMTTGGLFVCDDPFSTSGGKIVFGLTPEFTGTGCVEIKGLATHEYDGQPVYAYF
jgi:hypothetical protein